MSASKKLNLNTKAYLNINDKIMCNLWRGFEDMEFSILHLCVNQSNFTLVFNAITSKGKARPKKVMDNLISLLSRHVCPFS